MDIIKKDLITKFLSCIKGACMNMTSEKSLNCALDSFSGLVESVEESSQSSSSVIPPLTGDYLYFEAAEANSTVSMISTLLIAPNLEYSTDGINFQEWQYITADGIHTFDTLTLGVIGDRVYLKGVNPNGLADLDEELMTIFTLSGKLNSGGSITSVLDGDGVSTTTLPFGALSALFAGFLLTGNPDNTLLSAPTLGNVTVIGDSALSMLFFNCQSLTSVMDMANITSIGNEGCSTMYAACYALTASADMANVTSIADQGCYFMYSMCGDITTPADMSSVVSIGQEGCKAMYENCTSLQSASDLSSLISFYRETIERMYNECYFDLVVDDNLTFDFPSFPVTTVDEYTFSTASDVATWMRPA